MPTLPTRDAWVETPLGRLFVRIWPGQADDIAKPPIVLFHDSLGCVELWRAFPEQLARASGRNVIAYDRLGFGRSDPNPGRLDTNFICDEARTMLPLLHAQLGLGDFVAFGHSVGGAMATACAAMFPAQCRALITESAQAFTEDRTLQGIRDAARSFAQEEQVARLRRYHGDKTPWVLSAWIDTWQLPEFASWSLDEVLPSVRCPVLAIHGDNDEFGSALHPQRIRDLSGGPATMLLLTNCGHVPHREQAQVVIEAVLTILA
jgi:pimeloyl-ACP methyl ester carboxylesterase